MRAAIENNAAGLTEVARNEAISRALLDVTAIDNVSLGCDCYVENRKEMVLCVKTLQNNYTTTTTFA